MELLPIIIEILSDNKQLKAKDINYAIKNKFGITCKKSEINLILYKYTDIFESNSSYSWSIKKTAQKVGIKNDSKDKFMYSGIVKQIFDSNRGIFNKRAWKKRNVLIETKNGKLILATDWKDLIEKNNLTNNDKISFEFEIAARKGKFGQILNYVNLLDLKKM
ncbi:MAG: hypothetical protein U0Y08_11830 [Bacteroidia bacterium]